MEELKEKNKKLITCGIVLLIIILLVGGYCSARWLFAKDKQKKDDNNEVFVTDVTDYDINLIKEINKLEKDNYLISPYSIEMALSMLRDGASGKTREEIESLIGNREMSDLRIKEKINVANGVFINKKYKEKVLDSYYELVKDKYNSDIIYDKFKSPKVINDWVNKETYQMIPKLLDILNPDTIMVLVNALAIDVEWKNGFDCKNTYNQEFTKKDNSKINVSMMHKTYYDDAKYFETNDSKGIIIPYQSYDKDGNKVKENGYNLEFIGILPNNDVKSYVDNLSLDELKKIDEDSIEASDNKSIQLSLPRFKYKYQVNDFNSNLKNLGIKKVFTNKANLSRMVDMDAYVSKVVHKTYIDLKEKGTKAAAVTGIIVNETTSVRDEERHVVEFNKPFAYIIRDHKTKEMLFFGVVYEPNKWQGSTCK